MSTIQFSICHIFISSAHNFVGHHGMEPDHHVMSDVESVECRAGLGLVGDRYFDYKPDWKGQVTFFDMAVYRAVLEHCLAGVDPSCVSPSVFRRNILTDGLDLNDLIGRHFSIGDVGFSGVEECSPCYWMDKSVGQGVKSFLHNRGGLRARILSNGSLRVGECSATIHVN